MADNGQTEKVLVIPCSGIGKVHGLISREAVYRVTDNLLPGRRIPFAWPCWSRATPRRSRRSKQTPCITLDGCPKLCAMKNVELSGGKIAKGIRVYDVMKRHRGANFGTATALSDEGWTVVEELAAEVAEAAKQADTDVEGSVMGETVLESRHYFL